MKAAQEYSRATAETVDEVAEKLEDWERFLDSVSDKSREAHLLNELIQLFVNCADNVDDLVLWRGIGNLIDQAYRYCSEDGQRIKAQLFHGIQETLTGFFPDLEPIDAGRVVLLVQILHDILEEESGVAEDLVEKCQDDLGSAVRDFFQHHDKERLLTTVNDVATRACNLSSEAAKKITASLAELKKIIEPDSGEGKEDLGFKF